MIDWSLIFGLFSLFVFAWSLLYCMHGTAWHCMAGVAHDGGGGGDDASKKRMSVASVEQAMREQEALEKEAAEARNRAQQNTDRLEEFRSMVLLLWLASNGQSVIHGNGNDQSR